MVKAGHLRKPGFRIDFALRSLPQTPKEIAPRSDDDFFVPYQDSCLEKGIGGEEG
jgi:hypothetical protein